MFAGALSPQSVRSPRSARIAASWQGVVRELYGLFKFFADCYEKKLAVVESCKNTVTGISDLDFQLAHRNTPSTLDARL
jgi:hypothetical protein